MQPAGMSLSLMPIELVISVVAWGDRPFSFDQFAQSPLASNDGEGIDEHIALDGPAGEEQRAQSLGKRGRTAHDLAECLRLQARLGGRQRHVELAFKFSRQGEYRLALAQGSSRLLHGIGETSSVSLEVLVHLRLGWIKGANGRHDLLWKRRLVRRDVRADLVVFLDHSQEMTSHAGDPVDHLSAWLSIVADDPRGRDVQALAIRLHQHVGLQTVGEVEDDLAAVVLEIKRLLARPHGVGEEVLGPLAFAAVVALPVCAVGQVRLVPLDHPVVLQRHA